MNATQSPSPQKGVRKKAKAVQGSQKGKGKGKKKPKDDPKQLKLPFASVAKPSISACLAATEGSVAGPSTQPAEESQRATQHSQNSTISQLKQLKIPFASSPRPSSRPATQRTGGSQSTTQAPPTQLSQTQIPSGWVTLSSSQAISCTQRSRRDEGGSEIPKLEQMKLLDWLKSGGTTRYLRSQVPTQTAGLGQSGFTQGSSSTQQPGQTQATQSTQISAQLPSSSALPGQELPPDLSAPGVRRNSAGDYVLTEPDNMGTLCRSCDTIMKTDAKKLFRVNEHHLDKCPSKKCLARDYFAEDLKAKVWRDLYYQRDVELIAWQKYGGFWNFVQRLCVLEDRYVAGGKLKERFPLPSAYKSRWANLSTATASGSASSSHSSEV